MPEGVDEAAVRKVLLEDYDLEIGAGLGDLAGKVWRIGLMGYASNPTNVRLCLAALEHALKAQGVDARGAVTAADLVYADAA